MSDEVKQAADRLRRWDDAMKNGHRHAHEYSCRDNGLAMSRIDVNDVAAAYLAEHASDAENALPLTAEILQASGWRPGAYGWIHADVRLLLFQEIGLHDSEPRYGWRVAGLAGNARVETVGDLRKLTEALHIDAVVTVPKGGD